MWYIWRINSQGGIRVHGKVHLTSYDTCPQSTLQLASGKLFNPYLDSFDRPTNAAVDSVGILILRVAKNISEGNNETPGNVVMYQHLQQIRNCIRLSMIFRVKTEARKFWMLWQVRSRVSQSIWATNLSWIIKLMNKKYSNGIFSFVRKIIINIKRFFPHWTFESNKNTTLLSQRKGLFFTMNQDAMHKHMNTFYHPSCPNATPWLPDP